MKKDRKELQAGDRVFVGIDLYKKKWHVTARTTEFVLGQRQHSKLLESTSADTG